MRGPPKCHKWEGPASSGPQSRRFRKNFGLRSDLLVFTDDFVATGALVAMLSAGVAIPRDVRVVSLSNRGLGPVFLVSLTRIENDPVKHGEQLAEAVCAFLAGRRIRKGMGVIAPEYIVGESFPLLKIRQGAIAP